MTISLSVEDILCILALLGSLLFSLIKREHVLLITTLFLISITQNHQGRIISTSKILPDMKLDGTMSMFYDFSLKLERQLLDDLGKMNGIFLETLFLLVLMGQRNKDRRYIYSKTRIFLKVLVILSAICTGLAYLTIYFQGQILNSFIMEYIDFEQFETILSISKDLLSLLLTKNAINGLFLFTMLFYMLENRSFSSTIALLIMTPLKIVLLVNDLSQAIFSYSYINIDAIVELIDPIIYGTSNLIYLGYSLIFICWVKIILSSILKGKTKITTKEAMKKKNDDILDEDREDNIINNLNLSTGYTESLSDDNVKELIEKEPLSTVHDTSTSQLRLRKPKTINEDSISSQKHDQTLQISSNPIPPTQISSKVTNISKKSYLTTFKPSQLSTKENKGIKESNTKSLPKSKLKAPSRVNLINNSVVKSNETSKTSKNVKSEQELQQESKFKKRSLSDLTNIEILQSIQKIPSAIPIDQTKVILYFGLDYNKIIFKDIEKDEVLFEMKDHQDAISDIKFYDQNRYLVSSSFDKTVRIWDIQSRKLEHTISDYKSEITCLYINHTHKLIVTGSVDGEIKVWNIETSSFVATVNANTYISSIILTDDYKILSVLKSNTIVVWNMKAGELESVFHGNSRITNCLFNHTSNQIIASDDHIINIWNLNSKENERALISTRGTITSLVTLSEKKLISGTDDGYFIIWDMQSGEIIDDVKAHNGSVISIFKESHDTIVTYGMDCKLNCWNLNNLSIPESKIINKEIGDKVSRHYKNISVLVATNDSDVLESLKNTLSNLGYINFKSVDNVEDLKSLLSDNHIDILFLDIMIYKTDSVEDYLLSSIGDQSDDFYVSIIKSNELWFLDIQELFESVNYNVDVIHKPITSLDVDKVLKEVEERILFKEKEFPLRKSASKSIKHYEESVKNYIESYYSDIIPQEVSDFRSNPATCRTTTALYCNIQDFSELTANMSVQELMDFINGYYAFTVTPVIEHGGNIDKFFGDAILSIFTHNVNDSSVSALRCAVNIQQNVNFINKNSKQKINTTIGIHTEKSVIGFIGVQKLLEPTILGDSYGISVRLESLCRVYHSNIIITEYTKENMGNGIDHFILRELDYVAVKGLKNPCRIYEVIDGEPSDILANKMRIIEEGNWNEALSVYQSGNFKKAKEMFENCLTIYSDDQPSKIYIERCNMCISSDEPIVKDTAPITEEISEWDAIFL